MSDAFLRFPTVSGDSVAFVAEDDVWLAPLAGDRAWRLTADAAPVAGTRFSPDGSQIAFLSRRDGAPEVHVVPAAGGASRRLTFWGDQFTRVIGWVSDAEVLAISAAGEPFRSRTWAYAVPLAGGQPRRLEYGPVTAVAPGPDGALVLGVHGNRRGAASWKRYRGGTAGKLWIDPTGSGTFERLLGDINGQFEHPNWIGNRITFLSDHEGYGNVYSCAADGSELRRQTDHGDFYARAASSDGARIVYQCAGELWLLSDVAEGSQPQRLDITLGGPRTARQPQRLAAADNLGEFGTDQTGVGSLIEVRGTVHWLAHRDGPARLLAGTPGVRARLPRAVGADRVAFVSDAAGEDALHIVAADGSGTPLRIGAGDLGRVLDLAVAPDGSMAAVATHDGRVLLVDCGSAAIRELDAGVHGDSSGLTFAPDSRWLAWSAPGPEPLRQIRLASVEPGSPVLEATPLRFTDSDPVFTTDGKHLSFLSVRTFDPIYDAFVFDLSFFAGTRPYLLPLAAGTASPWHPSPGGRPMSGPAAEKAGEKAGDKAGDTAAETTDEAIPPVVVDVDGLAERVIPLPVPAGHYSGLRAGQGGLLWLADPLTGELGDGLPHPGAPRPRSVLQRYDLTELHCTTLADAADGFAVTGDGKWILLHDGDTLKVVPADRKPAEPAPGADSGSDSATLDLARIQLEIDPVEQWRQMFDENGRLMRDHYWIADMAGVDWDGVLARYRPWLDRVGSRDDLSEVLWEVQGELGTSHAYETPPERSVEPTRRLGLLGADLAPDPDGVWRVIRVLPGESSAPAARSPLSAPGVGVHAGDAIVAVAGRAVDPLLGPAALLVGAAETPIELTITPGDGAEQRRVVVIPLTTEMPLRYQDWVTGRRRAVHEATDGRVGYLHIPDMVSHGWAQLHRDLRVEVARDGLVVDVRDNNGGHTSSLVLEKLARRVQGWATVRHMQTSTYPEDSPRGPLVAITNQEAGSDGDIVTAAFQQMQLGTVIGTRTWGGVIGIDGRYHLVDGTAVTQPRYSFWFTGLGWGVENYGVEPDIEVAYPPQDWAAGRDPQLDAAVELVLQQLAAAPAARPPDPVGRPDRAAPALPPR